MLPMGAEVANSRKRVQKNHAGFKPPLAPRFIEGIGSTSPINGVLTPYLGIQGLKPKGFVSPFNPLDKSRGNKLDPKLARKTL